MYKTKGKILNGGKSPLTTHAKQRESISYWAEYVVAVVAVVYSD